tara:strand:- start:1970 stop:2764 length:795 start_codon:yes stop_codon:yes gene_type:complete
LRAIILAAGEGKRLGQLTKDRPKCLTRLFGKSLLQYQLDVFQNCDINDISIVTGYKSDMIKFPNITYFHNPDYQNTNMLETLFCAQRKIDDQIIVTYSDIIFEKRILELLLEEDEDISIIVDSNWKKYWNIRFKNPLDDAESLEIDKHGYIQSIGQNVDNLEKIQGQYTGLMKFQKKGCDIIKKFYKTTKNLAKNGKNPLNENIPFEKSYMTDFLQGMINHGYKIKAIPIRSGWLELDSVHDYEVYNKKFKDKTISEFFSVNDI